MYFADLCVVDREAGSVLVHLPPSLSGCNSNADSVSDAVVAAIEKLVNGKFKAKRIRGERGFIV
jgi:hypothetical protein